MIEARVRRALTLTSVLFFIIFGALSTYRFYDSLEIESKSIEWETLNGQWYTANCARNNIESSISAMCASSTDTKVYFMYEPGRNKDEAIKYIIIAILAPIGIWIAFFMGRWIWIGKII